MGDTLRQHRPLIVCELHYDRSDRRCEAIRRILRENAYAERMNPLNRPSAAHLIAVPEPALARARE
jgi:hypothetical protein